MMLGNGVHRRIVASTLAEIRGALPLAKEGVLDEVYSTYIFTTDHKTANTTKVPLRPPGLPQRAPTANPDTPNTESSPDD